MPGKTAKVDSEETNKEKLRRLLDENLLRERQLETGSPENLFGDVKRQAHATNIPWNPSAILEYWWWLARIGAIALSGQHVFTISDPVPFFMLTNRGRILLEQRAQSPHDPQRYYETIKEKVGTPDEVVMAYLDEAVHAWAAGIYRASAVMLGCACERLILLLAQTVSEANVPPWSGRLKKNLGKASDSPVGVNAIFKDVYDALDSLSKDKKLPGNLADALDRRLTSMFEHSRGLRNLAGHPTATDVSYEEAEASLLLFPGFYSLINDIMMHFSHNTQQATT